MHVDVNFVVGHLEEKERGGENVAGKNVAIRLVDRMQDEAIANEAAIHEYVDAIAIGALDFGARRKSVDADACAFFVGLEFGFGDGGAEGSGGGWNFDQFVERLLAKELVD